MKSFSICMVCFAFNFQLLWADSGLCTLNNSPFHQYHYIPCSSVTSRLDSIDFQLISERSNIFYYDEGRLLDDETAIVDGEVSRQILKLEKKVHQFVFGFELSELAFSEGNWDSAIEGWHSTFNFVNWDRENYPRDELQYSYQSADSELVITSSQKYQRFSYHVGFALNDSNNWLNNIRLGYAKSEGNQLVAPATTWVSFQLPVYNLSGAHLINANFGASHSEKNGFLAEIQRPWLYFGSVNYEHRWYRNFSFLFGLSGNTAHYDSESVVLGKPASQMAAALAWGFTRKSQLSIAIVEDIQIGASPDVTLQVAYRYKSH